MYPDPNRPPYHSYPPYSPFPLGWVLVGGVVVMVLTIAVLMIFVIYGPRQIAKDLGLRLVEQYGSHDGAVIAPVEPHPTINPFPERSSELTEPKNLSALERVSFPSGAVGLRLQRTIKGDEISRFALTMQQDQVFVVETNQPHAAVRLSTSKGVPLYDFQRRLQVRLPVDDTYVVGVHSTHNRGLTVTITFTAY